MAYGKALSALSHPARRSLYERLRRGEQAVGELARAVRRSQPLVSQHLRVLKDARLVRDAAEGNRRLYRLDPDGFHSLREYLDQFWTEALSAFKQRAETRRPRKRR